jgi:hypothetical protein
MSDVARKPDIDLRRTAPDLGIGEPLPSALRNAPSTTPDLAAECCGPLRSLVPATGLGPSTTSVSPSDQHSLIVTNGNPAAQVCSVL